MIGDGIGEGCAIGGVTGYPPEPMETAGSTTGIPPVPVVFSGQSVREPGAGTSGDGVTIGCAPVAYALG